LKPSIPGAEVEIIDGAGNMPPRGGPMGRDRLHVSNRPLRKERIMSEEQVPVLIVGAGAAGLSLALLLLQQGIHPLLIERRADISIYPRARNLNFRTLEVFRGLGLAADVRSAGTRISQVIFKETLASREERILDPGAGLLEHTEAISPDPFGWWCPQSRLEPLLLATAVRERGPGGRRRPGPPLLPDAAGVSNAGSEDPSLCARSL
jgi:hypothetical protein